MTHKSGFVAIIGAPNVGKSTLMNALVGEKLSIITPKAQTTRHKILGIVNAEDYQMIFTDTPGIIKPSYTLHKAMMHYVEEGIKDADVVLYVIEAGMTKVDPEIQSMLEKTKAPVYLVINKIDLSDQEKIGEQIEVWKTLVKVEGILIVSALNKYNIDGLKETILIHLPEHPPYYDKDQLTDKPEKFFASEIIREKIFIHYKAEIPYSCEVVIASFKDEEKRIRIEAEIFVMRETQKIILIGKKGVAIKNVGIAAGRSLEQFFQKEVFLHLFVKVKENWRENNNQIRQFGYEL